MGPLGAPGHIMAGGIRTGVPIANSCRFNDNDSAFTDWSPAGSGDDLTLSTLSFWMKRGNILGAQAAIISGGDASTNRDTLEFYTTDALRFVQTRASATVADIRTDMVFRDPSAWYHIVVQYDSDQAASADRLTIWVNGVEVAYTVTNAIDSGRSIYWSNDEDKRIGAHSWTGSGYFDGYLAEMHYCDGTAYTMADFGESNAQGHWIPKTPSVTYGTQGWHLDFAVAPGTGNGAGTDVSGNANHFTDSGLAANDQRTDTPTDNACTFGASLLTPGHGDRPTVANGNLELQGDSGSRGHGDGTMAVSSGKWYFEVVVDALTTNDNDIHVGISNAKHITLIDRTNYTGATEYGWGVTGDGASSVITVYHAASGSNLTSTHNFIATDVIMVAFDVDNSKLWFGVNGTWFDSGDPAAGTGAQYTDIDAEAYFPSVALFGASTQLSGQFHADDLSHTPPTGFKTFQVSSLTDTDDAPIPKGSDYFDVLTWSGDGSNPRAITGLDFQPDAVWFKARTNTSFHHMYDSVRGANKTMFPNDTNPETAVPTTGDLNSFDSGGFTADTGTTNDEGSNDGTDTYVAWCWKMGVKPGFDIQLYSGTGVQKQETHDLGVAPDFVVVKERTDDVGGWWTYQSDILDASSVPVTDPETDFMVLEGNNIIADAANIWGDTAPDAVDFTIDVHDDVNGSGDTYVAYLWANVAGFSRQGSYVGNGSADGPFVWCGFRPRWAMFKRLNGAVNNWVILDSERDASINPHNSYLLADTTAAEASSDYVDFLANGFKMRGTQAATNASGGEYIYLAFAEHPFKYARAF